uniref:Uncharacterized protein n=1 Tax=Haptolina brevifila TaxID=156173 RepID=A0A7S2CHE5_9EUKA|mmetsp:Transcript_24966/g.50168  ORF Transcript_24966/g.50168 Transcript_24966/m.50168 type:complete len:569 (+) Transcript_24966:64-1770(+)|eukprot:CAMPEP_0174704332 /NCGR_PEP_ID=MMETSP1094-20130205/7965_1 /TAXON_ID=156173 /ORGANISM="Chrysochromulina brevifilum, Strain UTEX LB 985" /LENGTH=568 /DNA_ID=CAMNT_0015902381 /DNA_START=60 /DNA_END=1766 /DNA_ORIENTATION=-
MTAALALLWQRRRQVAWLITAAATAVALYRLYHEEDEDEDVDITQMSGSGNDANESNANAEAKAKIEQMAHEARRRTRSPSFSVTNEHGEDRGALLDERAHAWGWLMDPKPLGPAAKSSIEPALRRHRCSSPNDELAKLTESVAPPMPRKSVRFRLDEDAMFYGFVFTYEGVCVAHGADTNFVGLSLCEVLRRTSNTEVDGADLHCQFKEAAEQGGGWVSYSWRNSSQRALQCKGAYIIKIVQWGSTFYAGVGYSLVPPPEPQPADVNGLYGFICTTDGTLLAHGASSAFVGSTLADVIESTDNTQIDSTSLLQRFDGAARLGGGWVTYPWRNSASSPMRQKGCFITRLEHRVAKTAEQTARHAVGKIVGKAPGETTAEAAGEMSAEVGEGAAAEAALKLLQHQPGSPSQEYLYAGVGYFGRGGEAAQVEGKMTGEPAQVDSARGGSDVKFKCSVRSGTQHITGSPPPPPPVPPSPAAAKAATAVLKANVLRAMDMRTLDADAMGVHTATASGVGWSEASALDAIVSDASGELAAAAAAATCWQATAMPAALRELLKDHATSHLASFH